MIRGIHHVALNTHDMERLQSFYVDVLGFEVVHTAHWADNELIDQLIALKGSAAKVAVLKAGNCFLEIFEYSSPAPRDGGPLRPCDRGYTHFCLDVTDIQQEYDRLTAAGMKFSCRPGELGGDAGEAGSEDRLGTISAVYGYDPDGNIIEIQEVLDPTIAYHPSRLAHLVR